MTDRELLNKIKDRDRETFEILYKRYERLFYNWILSRLNDRDATCDLLQDFWVKIWMNPDKIVANEKESAKDYLLRNLTFRLLKFIQQKAVRLEIADDNLIEKHIPDFIYTHISEDLYVKEILQQIDEILEKLPVLTRRIYEMRHLKEISVKETATALNITEGTVYNGYSQALSTIRRELTLHYAGDADKLKTLLPFLLLLLGK